MTKQDLVVSLVKTAKCSKKRAIDCLNTIITNITKSLIKGESVILTGFGTFKVMKRAARIGRNPKTGRFIKKSLWTNKNMEQYCIRKTGKPRGGENFVEY